MTISKLAGVSVVIATLNAQRSLGKCLTSITDQTYLKSLLEVLIVDGGSTDSTLEIAKSFSTKLDVKIISAGWSDNQEARRFFGFKKARFEFVCVMDSDNYFGSSKVLQKLVQPLVSHPEIVGSFSLHYQFVPSSGLLNRYIGLFGHHDPVAFYLGKADRKKMTQTSWPDQSQIVSQTQQETIVKFNHTNFPTLGSNGFVVRKSLLKIEKLGPESFFHTDILFDLLANGYNQYAVVDVPIAHESSSSVMSHLRRRMEYMSLHTLSLSTNRRYLVFNQHSVRDLFNLGKYAVYTLTMVEPLLQSITGYIKKSDRAWFLHPILCWAFLLTYSLALIKKVFN